MKQCPRPTHLSISFALLTSAILAACGGGGQSEESFQSASTASGLSAAASSAGGTAPGDELAAAQTASPSPSNLSLAAVDASTVASQSGESFQIAGASTQTIDASVAEAPTTQAMATAAIAKLPLTRDSLMAFNKDFTLNHEALPQGVPSAYDWYSKPRKGTWNTPPAGFSAITGWGQAFWVKGTTTPSAYLLMKTEMTLVCHGSQRQWSLVQSSGVQGAVFQPDYSTNIATKASSPGLIEAGALAISFPTTTAYHFWPTMSRGSLPSDGICGTLTLVQARAQPYTASSYNTPNLLLGMGADYWLNLTAPWDNYKTNRDVAIGRLKLVKTTWAWYGLSTASDADLDRLYTNGYTVLPQ